MGRTTLAIAAASAVMPSNPFSHPRSEAAKLLGRRSVEVREEAWGRKEFVRRMREWGNWAAGPRAARTRARTAGSDGLQAGEEQELVV